MMLNWMDLFGKISLIIEEKGSIFKYIGYVLKHRMCLLSRINGQ